MDSRTVTSKVIPGAKDFKFFMRKRRNLKMNALFSVLKIRLFHEVILAVFYVVLKD